MSHLIPGRVACAWPDAGERMIIVIAALVVVLILGYALVVFSIVEEIERSDMND
jgi:Tfp pilus assembly protein PilO